MSGRRSVLKKFAKQSFTMIVCFCENVYKRFHAELIRHFYVGHYDHNLGLCDALFNTLQLFLLLRALSFNENRLPSMPLNSSAKVAELSENC